MDPITTALIGLAGGAVALLGQVIVQRLIAGFNRAKDRDALLREKGEELVAVLMDYTEWCGYHTGYKEDRPNPLHKARALQRLYFPVLDEPMVDLLRIHKEVMGPMDRLTVPEDERGQGIPYVGGLAILGHMDGVGRVVDGVIELVRKTFVT